MRRKDQKLGTGTIRCVPQSKGFQRSVGGQKSGCVRVVLLPRERAILKVKQFSNKLSLSFRQTSRRFLESFTQAFKLFASKYCRQVCTQQTRRRDSFDGLPEIRRQRPRTDSGAGAYSIGQRNTSTTSVQHRIHQRGDFIIISRHWSHWQTLCRKRLDHSFQTSSCVHDFAPISGRVSTHRRQLS